MIHKGSQRFWHLAYREISLRAEYYLYILYTRTLVQRKNESMGNNLRKKDTIEPFSHAEDSTWTVQIFLVCNESMKAVITSYIISSIHWPHWPSSTPFPPTPLYHLQCELLWWTNSQRWREDAAPDFQRRWLFTHMQHSCFLFVYWTGGYT